MAALKVRFKVRTIKIKFIPIFEYFFNTNIVKNYGLVNVNVFD